MPVHRQIPVEPRSTARICHGTWRKIQYRYERRYPEFSRPQEVQPQNAARYSYSVQPADAGYLLSRHP